MEEGIIKRLMSSMKCGSCGQIFTEDNVDVLGNSEEMWFVQAICTECQTQSLIVAIIQKCSGNSSCSDLTEGEKELFTDTNPVDDDYLLDMHTFLQGFDGNFTYLFGKYKTR